MEGGCGWEIYGTGRCTCYNKVGGQAFKQGSQSRDNIASHINFSTAVCDGDAHGIDDIGTSRH